MYFDAHSDIWTDVTVKREHGEKNVLKNHHLDRLRAGQVEGSIFVIWVERPDIQDYAIRTAQIKQAILDETAECDEDVYKRQVLQSLQIPYNTEFRHCNSKPWSFSICSEISFIKAQSR